MLKGVKFGESATFFGVDLLPCLCARLQQWVLAPVYSEVISGMIGSLKIEEGERQTLKYGKAKSEQKKNKKEESEQRSRSRRKTGMRAQVREQNEKFHLGNARFHVQVSRQNGKGIEAALACKQTRMWQKFIESSR